MTSDNTTAKLYYTLGMLINVQLSNKYVVSQVTEETGFSEQTVDSLVNFYRRVSFLGIESPADLDRAEQNFHMMTAIKLLDENTRRDICVVTT